MDHDRFDGLTRALAGSTSRRQALKLLGGGLLAALVPGSLLAKGGNNSTCAKFCATTFGADTPAAKQCTADAAKGKGLCYSCGPASSGGTKDICCPQNPNGTCTSYNSASCCSNGQTCQNGTCMSCVPPGGVPSCGPCCLESDLCCSGIMESTGCSGICL